MSFRPFFLALVLPFALQAQLDNSALLYHSTIDSGRAQQAYLQVRNLNFLKNNEYYNPIADGYTLFGVQLNPRLGYQLSSSTSLEGGVFVNKDFGNNSFTQLEPSFTFRYHQGDFKLLFGNIEGSLNHQLIEPVYNFERVLNRRQESGLQLLLDKRYFDVDIWVDWQNAIYPYSNEQEKLWGGFSGHLLKLKGTKAELRVPMQMTVYHEGGQIDTTRQGLVKNFVYAPGMVLHYFPGTGPIQKWIADGRLVFRSHAYLDSVTTRSEGHGVMGNVGFSTQRGLDVLLSYWYGDNYYTDMGGFLYSSRATTVAYAPRYSERFRSLLIMRITKRWQLPGNVNLVLRAEPHYDILKRQFEYAFGLYIHIDQKVWFKRR